MRRYWVPSTCRQLREELRKAGITRISGRPLSRVRKKQLYAVFFRLREKQLEEGNDVAKS
jgi:hypothetical protein